MNVKEEIKDIISIVVGQSGSDIHLSNGLPPIIRVFRKLSPVLQKKELTEEDMFEFARYFLDEEKMDVLNDKKYVYFSYVEKLENSSVRFRGTCFIDNSIPVFALRYIPSVIPSLEELHLPPVLRTLAKKRSGFFILAGSTGNGKSTTIASVINYINKNLSKHIITIEDPIEFVFNSDKSFINQREIGLDVRSFDEGIDSALRSDADVLFIGEMRTAQNMFSGMTAAEIGHLTFSTVHANSSTQAINRIIDSFPDTEKNQIRTQISHSLLGIMSIRLIPRVTGGLVPAYEIFFNNTAVSNIILENRLPDIYTVIQSNLHEGMIQMEQSIANLVKQGEVSLEIAQSYGDKEMIGRFLQ